MNVKLDIFEASLASLDKVLATWCEKTLWERSIWYL